MLGIEKKKQIIARICKSKTFSNAPTSISLLQYLFEATQKNTDLKEAVIEIEFFGTDGHNGGKTPKVRVNVYNLRHKLAKYYEEEGKHDEVKVVIEKGQYQVQFENNKQNKPIFSATVIKRSIPYLFSLFFLVAFLTDKMTPEAPAMWQPFLQDDFQTTLYVGDVFGMIGRTITGNPGWTRDYSINNLDEFYSFCELHPELKNKLLPPPYTYTTQMGVLSTKYLQKFFQPYRKDFQVRFVSKSSIDDIIEGNAIYVGPIKNNNPFIGLFNEANPFFKLRDSSLVLRKHPEYNDTSYALPYQVQNKEYAVVSKIPGPNGTFQFLFFANHDIGVSATMQFFTAVDSVKAFESKYSTDNKNFTAVFEAKGIDRTDTDLKLIQVVTW